jgi:hypothetical protein
MPEDWTSAFPTGVAGYTKQIVETHLRFGEAYSGQGVFAKDITEVGTLGSLVSTEIDEPVVALEKQNIWNLDIAQEGFAHERRDILIVHPVGANR